MTRLQKEIKKQYHEDREDLGLDYFGDEDDYDYYCDEDDYEEEEL